MYCTSCGKFIEGDTLLCDACTAERDRTEKRDYFAKINASEDVTEERFNVNDSEHIACSNTGLENSNEVASEFAPPRYYTKSTTEKPIKKGIGAAVFGLICAILTNVFVILSLVLSLFDELVTVVGALAIVSFGGLVLSLTFGIISIKKYSTMRVLKQKPSAAVLVMGIITAILSLEPLFVMLTLFLFVFL